MKTIREILQQTPQHYDMMLFDFWFKWCQKRAIDDMEFQALISNPGINEWFIAELDFYENQFRERIMPFIGSASKKDLLDCYNSTCEAIYNNWPRPAVQQVRKNIAGIRISLLTYNQN